MQYSNYLYIYLSLNSSHDSFALIFNFQVCFIAHIFKLSAGLTRPGLAEIVISSVMDQKFIINFCIQNRNLLEFCIKFCKANYSF